MERMICLDGVAIRLDVDRVEIDLNARGLQPSDHEEDAPMPTCGHGEPWQPVMSYHDGTTVYLHTPPAGGAGPPGYKVACPRPHRWIITFVEDAEGRVAHLGWEPA